MLKSTAAKVSSPSRRTTPLSRLPPAPSAAGILARGDAQHALAHHPQRVPPAASPNPTTTTTPRTRHVSPTSRLADPPARKVGSAPLHGSSSSARPTSSSSAAAVQPLPTPAATKHTIATIIKERRASAALQRGSSPTTTTKQRTADSVPQQRSAAAAGPSPPSPAPLPIHHHDAALHAHYTPQMLQYVPRVLHPLLAECKQLFSMEECRRMSRITEAKRQQALGMRLEGVTAAAIFSFLLTTATPTANARGLSPTSRLRAVTPPTTAPLPRVATLFQQQQQHSNALNARRAVSPVLRRVDPHGLGVGSASSRAAPKTTSPTRPQQQHSSASAAAAPPTAIVATTSTSSPTRRGLSPPLAQTSLRFHGPASNGGGAAAAVTTSTTPKRSSTTTTVTVPSPSSSLRGGGPPPPPALVVSSPSHHTPLGGRPSSASTPGRMLSPGSSSALQQLGRGRSPPRHQDVLLASPGSLGAVLHSSGGGSAVARTVSPTRASRWLEDFRYRLQSEGFDEGAWRQLTRGERDEWYLSWRLPQLQVCLLEREFGEGGGAPPSA